MADTITLSLDDLRRVARAIGRSIEFVHQPLYDGAGMCSLHPDDLAAMAWRALRGERARTIYRSEVVAPFQVDYFCRAYLHGEPSGLSPRTALGLMIPEAESLLGRSRFAEAMRAWNDAEDAERARRQSERDQPRIGRGGRRTSGAWKVGKGTRRRVYKLDDYRCVYCGVRVSPEWGDREGVDRKDWASVDHMAPGVHKFENYVTACSSCNSAKSNRTPEEAGMELRYGRFASVA